MGDAAYFIGIISGTSMDGIDCVAIKLQEQKLELVASHSSRYPVYLRQQLFNVCANPNVSLLQLGQLNVAVGKAFGNAINMLLSQHQLSAEMISAIGSHGQTIYHSPETLDAFSLQIGDPNTIASITGITTIADFRQRDISVGGQGAPLAPLFHQYFFHNSNCTRCILNIGGISNITLISDTPTSTPVGFDTGPGNALMDLWISRCLQEPFDAGGAWAASGNVHSVLLDRFLSDEYFQRKSPKSTGRELFNQTWLDRCLDDFDSINQADVQRTLLELTARSVADAVNLTILVKAGTSNELLVCGGGVHNTTLMSRLQQLLPAFEVKSTLSCGMPPEWIEASTFAWLASKTINKEKIDTGILTGASQPIILGGVYYS
ncbi:MAG: anhydro-N-acetylmuramic acid kinase [Pseudohongiella sp.]|nr:anhydro-N-acetylmuramic acid kinase [Pseudohongiella sp.]